MAQLEEWPGTLAFLTMSVLLHCSRQDFLDVTRSLVAQLEEGIAARDRGEPCPLRLEEWVPAGNALDKDALVGGGWRLAAVGGELAVGR